VATARQALEARNVAVFMPFILVHDKDPHSLTLAPDWPLAAWTAYSDFTRKHPFPSRVLALPPRDPNPVVVQWLPDNRTTIPHKVSGSYRFRNGQPIRGVLRIYNFSDEAVAGRLEATALAHVSVVGGYLGSAGLTVPPMGSIEIPVSFAPKSPGYFREYCQVEFVDDCGRRSPLYFGLEVTPRERDFVAVPVKPGLVKHGKIGHPMFHEFTVTSSSGVWTGINGLMVEEESAEKQGKTEEGRAGTLKAESGKSEKREPTGQSFLQEATEGTERLPASLETVAPVCDRRTEIALKAWVTKAENDPLLPTMAVAGIKGLPPHGFLRLRLDQPVDSGFRVRVDLVDRKGQRFTIWENLGANYYGPGDDVWLNLEDFHVYFWGRCSDRPVFHPEAVEEIQLRFYIARPNDPRTVKLTLMEPRNGV
jgi:hypothetical protein